MPTVAVGFRQSDLAQVEAMLSGITNGANTALRSALNDVQNGNRTAMVKQVPQELNVTATEARRRISITGRPTAYSLTSTLSVDYHGVRADDLKAKPKFAKASGVTALGLVQKGPLRFPHGFKSKFDTGPHRGGHSVRHQAPGDQGAVRGARPEARPAQGATHAPPARQIDPRPPPSSRSTSSSPACSTTSPRGPPRSSTSGRCRRSTGSSRAATRTSRSNPDPWTPSPPRRARRDRRPPRCLHRRRVRHRPDRRGGGQGRQQPGGREVGSSGSGGPGSPRAGAPLGFEEVDQPIEVECFACPHERRPDHGPHALARMAGDVRRKLMEDAHRGGYAIHTHFPTKDEGNATDAPFFVRVTAMLWCRHRLGNPYQAT